MSETIEMPNTRAIAAAMMSGAVLMSSDEAWRDFGFKRRPRQRPWHHRMLSGRAKDIELRVARLLFCCAIAAHIKSGCITVGEGVAVINASVKDPECVRLLGFESDLDAASDIGCLVLNLAECEPTRWGRELAGWLDLASIPNADERTQLVHGTIVLASSLRDMVHQLSTSRHRTEQIVEPVCGTPRQRLSVR